METLMNVIETLSATPHSVLFNPLAWIAFFVVIEAMKGIKFPVLRH